MCHLPPLNIVSCTCQSIKLLCGYEIAARAKSRLSTFFFRMAHKKYIKFQPFQPNVRMCQVPFAASSLSPQQKSPLVNKKVIVNNYILKKKKQKPPCGEERQMDEICYYFLITIVCSLSFQCAKLRGSVCVRDEDCACSRNLFSASLICNYESKCQTESIYDKIQRRMPVSCFTK